MTYVYPVVFTNLGDGYMAYVPDLKINTQGDTLAQAIYMARDAIGLTGITLQDDGANVPAPSPLTSVPHGDGEFVSMVDIDFDAYRRANDLRAVRKNVTIPGYLNDLAEKAGVNFSQVLQEGLRERLGVR